MQKLDKNTHLISSNCHKTDQIPVAWLMMSVENWTLEIARPTCYFDKHPTTNLRLSTTNDLLYVLLRSSRIFVCNKQISSGESRSRTRICRDSSSPPTDPRELIMKTCVDKGMGKKSPLLFGNTLRCGLVCDSKEFFAINLL